MEKRAGAADDFAGLRLAVLIPAFDAERTIGAVVADVRRALPGAAVHVFDAGSSDDTARQAALAGGHVHRDARGAGGQLLRHLIAGIDADVFVLAAADGSTRADDLPSLVLSLLSERADMAVAVPATAEFGARTLAGGALGGLLAAIFGRGFADPSARTRAFTRRFARSFPGLGQRFRIETDLSLHAARTQARVAVLPTAPDWDAGPGNSRRPGTAWTPARLFALLLEAKPFVALAALAAAALSAGLLAFAFGLLGAVFASSPALGAYLLAAVLTIVAAILASTGLILDSQARGRAEQMRIALQRDALPTAQ